MPITEQDFLNRTKAFAQGLIDFATDQGKQFGITDVKIAIGANEEQENSIEDGAVSSSISGMTYNVTITLYAGDRVVSFNKTGLNSNALQDAISQNIQIIHLVPENTDKALLESTKLHKGPRIDLGLYDQNPPSTEKMITYAKNIEKHALAQEGVKTARSTSITKNASHVLILATNGLDYYKSGTDYTAVTEVIAEKGSEMQVDYDFSMARHFDDMTPSREIGENAGKNARAKLGALLPQTGEMPIVLSNDAAESFFSTIYSAIDGTAVHRGTTFLKDKVGQQVMSKGITLVDNPRIKKGMSSRQIDTAGLECKEITFIEDGILNLFNVSVSEARKIGVNPIGRENGPTNSHILPGTKTVDDLIADIDDGVYIKNFSGGTIDVNNGTHSQQAYGVLIKDGEITDIAVDGFVVSGNLKDMFMNITLADDTPQLPNTKYTLAAPTTRIDGLTISGK